MQTRQSVLILEAVASEEADIIIARFKEQHPVMARRIYLRSKEVGDKVPDSVHRLAAEKLFPDINKLGSQFIPALLRAFT